MSFFHWLTTGSSNGILLEQEKEPAISKPFLPFYSATTLQAPTFEHGCDLSRPLSWQQLADIARRANIIDEHDGKPLADKIEQSARQKITTICIDAIDDEPYVSSQINPMLFCRNQIVQSANWLASALGATDRFIAVYKNMSLTDIKIPSFIESVEVRQMSGRYPMKPAPSAVWANRPLSPEPLLCCICTAPSPRAGSRQPPLSPLPETA